MTRATSCWGTPVSSASRRAASSARRYGLAAAVTGRRYRPPAVRAARTSVADRAALAAAEIAYIVLRGARSDRRLDEDAEVARGRQATFVLVEYVEPGEL